MSTPLAAPSTYDAPRKDDLAMVPLMPAFAAVLVTFLYCACDRLRQAETHRRKLMRKRVAELLFAAAQHGH